MTKSIRYLFLIHILSFSAVVFSQNTTGIYKYQSISLYIQYFQIKDQFNYGLVFNGGNLACDYSYIYNSNKKSIIYNARLGLGANYNKGIGVSIRLKPIDLFYGIPFQSHNITLGGYYSLDYHWQLYPELQSGHMFWLTSMEIGPRLIMNIPIKSRVVKVNLSNSIISLISRPVPATEVYFYSLKLADFISNAHSNMKFGSFNQYNHTDIRIELLYNKRKLMSMGYGFEYMGYYHNPKASLIYHSFNVKWKIGKK